MADITLNNVNLNQVPEINLQNLSLHQINSLLDSSVFKNTFTGKRAVLFVTSNFSIEHRINLCKTTFESLSKTVVDYLKKYPISTDADYENLPFIKKFDRTPRLNLERYKNDLELAKEVMQKISNLNEDSKKEIKQKFSFITRIFFFFKTLFSKVFSNNLIKAKKIIAIHEDFIEQKEALLKPLATHHKVSACLSLLTFLPFINFLVIQPFHLLENYPKINFMLYIGSFFSLIKNTFQNVNQN